MNPSATGQYIAAFGGLTCFNFLPDGKVEAWPLKVSDETRDNLRTTCCCSSPLLAQRVGDFEEPGHQVEIDDRAMIENLHFVKDLGLQARPPWKRGIGRVRAADGRHWQRKKQRSGGMSNPKINECTTWRWPMALGGKLIGAAEALPMFYAEDKANCATRCAERVKEVRFRFDFEGTKLVNS